SGPVMLSCQCRQS
ncbi:putative gp5 C-terminal domain protein, partial [Vibrio parahaemolyticus 10296]